MNPVRYGIVGIGNMGTSHAGWLIDGKVKGAVLTAVCDICPERKKWAEENVPIDIAFYSNYLELLDSKKIDAVLIAVPHYLHPTIAIEALKRDIHTLVEKPAGVYTKQIREMNEMAKTKPELVFGMMFNQRMNPLYQRVKEIMDSGTIGDIRRVNWLITSWWRTQKYYDSSEWRATWWGEGGGVLVNQAPHQLDLMQWLCGMPAKMRGYLQYGSQRHITVEDDVTAYFEYPNGATGAFITCTHDALGTDRLEIHGDNGKIIIDNSAKVTVKKLRKPEAVYNQELDFRQVLALVRGQGGEKLYDEESFECPEQWDVQHIDVLINFTDAILNGAALIAPGADGINAVTLSNAMHLSSWLGKEVSIPFDEDLFYNELQKRIAEEKAAKQ